MSKKIEVHVVTIETPESALVHGVYRSVEGADRAIDELTSPCDKCGGTANHKAESIGRTVRIVQP